MTRWLGALAVGVSASFSVAAPAARADPVVDPCQLAADPSEPLPESRRPADYCFNGCI